MGSKVKVEGIQWLESEDPTFEAGEVRTAVVSMTNPTAKGFSYTAHLYLDATRIASSAKNVILAAGETKAVSFPITIPPIEGTFHVYLDIFSVGDLVSAFQATEDVTIVILPAIWELEPSGLWVKHFDGSDDYVDCGVIFDSVETIFVSLWFKLDALFQAGAPHNMTMWGKKDNGNWIAPMLNAADGRLVFYMYMDGEWKTTLASNESSWASDTWFHVISSKSAANATRLRINGGTAKTHADKTALPAGGEFILGNKKIGATTEVLAGEIALVRVGLFDLSEAEELFVFEHDQHLLGV